MRMLPKVASAFFTLIYFIKIGGMQKTEQNGYLLINLYYISAYKTKTN